MGGSKVGPSGRLPRPRSAASRWREQPAEQPAAGTVGNPAPYGVAPEVSFAAGARPETEQDAMVTNLIADAVVPVWDRALLHALHDAVAGAVMDEPLSYIVVMNDSDGPYRQIVVHGPVEYRQLRDCFGALGIAPQIDAKRLLGGAPRPHPVGLA